MNNLHPKDTICDWLRAAGLLIATAFLISSLGCGGSNNNDKAGPQVGGGGDIDLSTAEEVQQAVENVRRFLKKRDLYMHMLASARVDPYSTFWMDQETMETLVKVINPNNTINDEPWSDYNYEIKNEIKDYIDNVNVWYETEGFCPANDKDNAMASVHPMDMTGSICFSSAKLMKQSKYALESVVAGLWAHELAHMNGHAEDVAKRIQVIFERNYMTGQKRYSLFSSQRYRNFLTNIYHLLIDAVNSLDPESNNHDFSTPDDYMKKEHSDNATKEDILEIVDEVQHMAMSLFQLLDPMELTKVCQKLDDNDRQTLRDRIIELESYVNGYKVSFRKDTLSNSDLQLRVNLTRFKVASIESMHCYAEEKFLCSSSDNRLATLNNKKSKVFLAFFNMSAFLLGEELMSVDANTRNTSSARSEGQAIQTTLIELKSILEEDLSCLENEDDIFMRDTHIENVNSIIEKTNSILTNEFFDKKGPELTNDLNQLMESLKFLIFYRDVHEYMG